MSHISPSFWLSVCWVSLNFNGVTTFSIKDFSAMLSLNDCQHQVSLSFVAVKLSHIFFIALLSAIMLNVIMVSVVYAGCRGAPLKQSRVSLRCCLWRVNNVYLTFHFSAQTWLLCRQLKRPNESWKFWMKCSKCSISKPKNAFSENHQNFDDSSKTVNIGKHCW